MLKTLRTARQAAASYSRGPSADHDRLGEWPFLADTVEKVFSGIFQDR
jgi:hypothetical protein